MLFFAWLPRLPQNPVARALRRGLGLLSCWTIMSLMASVWGSCLGRLGRSSGRGRTPGCWRRRRGRAAIGKTPQGRKAPRSEFVGGSLDGQAEACPLPDASKQIPCGNDRQKGKSNDKGNSRFPRGNGRQRSKNKSKNQSQNVKDVPGQLVNHVPRLASARPWSTGMCFLERSGSKLSL